MNDERERIARTRQQLFRYIGAGPDQVPESGLALALQDADALIEDLANRLRWAELEGRNDLLLEFHVHDVSFAVRTAPATVLAPIVRVLNDLSQSWTVSSLAEALAEGGTISIGAVSPSPEPPT